MPAAQASQRQEGLFNHVSNKEKGFGWEHFLMKFEVFITGWNTVSHV